MKRFSEVDFIAQDFLLHVFSEPVSCVFLHACLDASPSLILSISFLSYLSGAFVSSSLIAIFGVSLSTPLCFVMRASSCIVSHFMLRMPSALGPRVPRFGVVVVGVAVGVIVFGAGALVVVFGVPPPSNCRVFPR